MQNPSMHATFSTNAHIHSVIWKNINELFITLQVDVKGLHKYVQKQYSNKEVQKQYSNKQYVNPHKTYSDKPFKKRTVYFTKGTKSKLDMQELMK